MSDQIASTIAWAVANAMVVRSRGATTSVLPAVNRSALMVSRAAQPIRPAAPPGTGRLKLTRSPARHPSRNADTIRR